jgi:hypothetical protein
MGILDDVLGGGGSTAAGADPRTFSAAYWDAIRPNAAYYNTIKDFDPKYVAEQKAAADAAASTGVANATQAATASNPVQGPTQAESASEALGRLLSGFGGVAGGANFVPGTLDDPAIANIFGAQKTKAQDYINNLFKRGVVTSSGQQSGVAALSGQEPRVRSKLNDVGNLLLEQERGKVRGIYNEGASAAGSVPAGGGASFDPTPYVSRAQQDVGGFQGGLADAIAGSISGDLFDTSGLAGSSGAPSSGQASLDFDPYAGTGSKLNTGLDTGGSSTSTKRRSTAVF